ncbi:TPR repeat region circular profile [Acididesulfobacillus acetoxydans]|uniref:TPR repeat region circular profile n=1 Tax=Acididesulfobacillus acetoxydans TaxID=1561005 RepID=A0A8S0WL19_9FIRM|nr:tetratricopeptide repeat protein [Acididesulfobacillus acetoxydans]CAA7599774.1 TPR repeat region circular profile [Acididesulfobacillus acetoxydans]CEJ07340.1 Tetratricopeptide repeat protein [Acididesulfobacillus acetoxydans]
MKKRTQKALTIILAVFVTLSMVGSAAFSLFYPGFNVPPSSPATPSSSAEAAAAAEVQYHQAQSQVQDLLQKLKSQPDDVTLKEQLANAYYDLGVTATRSAPAEARGDFTKAVQGYQEILKVKKDTNLVLDLATAALYAGQNGLAEKSYQEALAQKPDSFDVLYSYGLFLAQAKQDYAGALKLWQKALAEDPGNANAAQLKKLIAQVEGLQKGKP